MLSKTEQLRADFITKSNRVHNNKYDYSKVQYVNAFTKVTIICPRHGEFSQVPMSHVRPTECPRCGQENRAKSKKHTAEKFIARARDIHGDKYDYSETIYNGAKHTVTITCKIHGAFQQKAMSHLIGYEGCGPCENAARHLSLEEFLQKAREKHGDKYNYSQVTYVNTHTKVKIICPRHGDFWQKPKSHFDKKGCISCRNSIGESDLSILFSKLNLEYTQEVRFPGCVSAINVMLSFDFHIPKYNLLVEFDGKQHFKSVKHWGGDDGLLKRIQNDNIKDNWCINNGKILLRIADKDIDNIAEIVKLAIEYIEIAREVETTDRSGYILATLFYDTICTTKNPNGIRDTSHYITIA